MEHALRWMNESSAKRKVIGVVVGNEQALGFYARFGFYPRVVNLEQTICPDD